MLNKNIKSGSDYYRDKQNGFGQVDNPALNSAKRHFLRLESLKIAALALSNIAVPNVADHGRKVIALSAIFEQHLRS